MVSKVIRIKIQVARWRAPRKGSNPKEGRLKKIMEPRTKAPTLASGTDRPITRAVERGNG
jgi:hypothetical protein